MHTIRVVRLCGAALERASAASCRGVSGLSEVKPLLAGDKPGEVIPRLPTGAVLERFVFSLVTASFNSALAANPSHWACVGKV